ncbi:hypothetical protein D5085_17380 [Ectothiorhodospiraceae bacterium BW-2]|nr:hypothetical protein D5085_17380 [Ectothiorhodospiraceae bacterium BW-2]
MNEAIKIREAIIAAIPYETSNYGQPPEPERVYMPRAHAKALNIESNLVVGSRGVGKSFWTAALNAPSLRSMLGSSVRELDNTQVSVGFSVNENIKAYPNREVFSALLGSGYTPYEIWKAVVLRWLAPVAEEKVLVDDWRATAAWVQANPEPLAICIQKANAAFHNNGRKGLIIFDALDRSSNDWRTMDAIVRDLLRIVLWLKSYPAINGKVFLREDQFVRTVTDFPDASKLLATQSELTWRPHDLHGLLWQLLCNAPRGHGETLRNIYGKIIGKCPEQREGLWWLADEAKLDGAKQRALFEELAGPWMGRDRRRGVPYVWSVSHLADGRGQTSPRSFLAAIRAAGEDSSERYLSHEYALHYESIKRGVQKASEIRIAEIAEDYPWVRILFKPLEGLTVPCDFSLIEERWKQQLPGDLSTLTQNRLPPQHLEGGWPGILEDLVRLGIFEKMRDGRFNMPDLYRVGFGLGRKGGVKPMRQVTTV